MPRLKPVHKYPEEYYQLCRKAHEGDVPVALRFESGSKARSFRVEMYQFRKAIRKALHANPNSTDMQEALLFAEGLEFTVQDHVLYIRKKDTVHAKTIREQI